VLQLYYGTLSPLLKRLEAAGLVTRVRRHDDERSVEIALTEAGEAMRARAQSVPDRLTCALGLDERGSRGLLETLKDVMAAVNRAAGEGLEDHGRPDRPVERHRGRQATSTTARTAWLGTLVSASPDCCGAVTAGSNRHRRPVRRSSSAGTGRRTAATRRRCRR
jgi:DNA-binding PadR family transcriptional regulator